MDALAVSEIVRRARGFVGTPWRHQGRSPCAGMDCVGVFLIILHERGLSTYDRFDYGRDPYNGELEAALECLFVRKIGKLYRPPDLLLFENPKNGRQHVGLVVSESRMVHAQAGHAVAECTIGGKWARTLKRVYAWDN